MLSAHLIRIFLFICLVASCALALPYVSRLQTQAPGLSHEDLTRQVVCNSLRDVAGGMPDLEDASKDCINEAHRLMNPPK
jgi:hypothetical protein